MNINTKHLAALALSMSLVLPTAVWAGEYSTVNKSISVDANSSVGDVSSVNGAVRIGDGAVARSVESVNGAIKVSETARVEENVEAVNGSIEVNPGAEVGGNVETVNGAIRLRNATVAGGVDTVNGGIKLLSGTVVEGDVTVHKPQGWSNNRRKPVKVEIGENVQVYGDLIFEHPVELRIHDSAQVGEVIGKDITILEG